MAFVWSQNAARRHLEKSQLAAAAVNALPWFEKEAKERQRKHGGTAPGKKNTQDINILSDSGKATDKVAKTVKVSGAYVAKAKAVKAKSPELFEQIRTGKKTITEAEKELRAKDKS